MKITTNWVHSSSSNTKLWYALQWIKSCLINTNISWLLNIVTTKLLVSCNVITILFFNRIGIKCYKPYWYNKLSTGKNDWDCNQNRYISHSLNVCYRTHVYIGGGHDVRVVMQSQSLVPMLVSKVSDVATQLIDGSFFPYVGKYNLFWLVVLSSLFLLGTRTNADILHINTTQRLLCLRRAIIYPVHLRQKTHLIAWLLNRNKFFGCVLSMSSCIVKV